MPDPTEAHRQKAREIVDAQWRGLLDKRSFTDAIAAALAEAVAAEREACRMVAYDLTGPDTLKALGGNAVLIAIQIAAAIRTRRDP